MDDLVQSSLTLQGGYCYFPHLRHGEAGMENLSKVLRVTDLVSNGTGILMLACRASKFALGHCMMLILSCSFQPRVQFLFINVVGYENK